MKLAWPGKISTAELPVRGDGSSMMLPEVFSAPQPWTTKNLVPPKNETRGFLRKFWEHGKETLKSFFSPSEQTKSLGSHPFLLSEQKHWKEQVETYAESPFEKILFYLKKKPNAYVISKAWAQGIKN